MTKQLPNALLTLAALLLGPLAIMIDVLVTGGLRAERRGEKPPSEGLNPEQNQWADQL